MDLYTPTPIVLPVSDRVVGDTVIKQKARFAGLLHLQTDEGECNARITVRVSLYAADATAPDGYGPLLDGPGLSRYTAELVADNNTLVDKRDGSILLYNGKLAIRQLLSAQEWEEAAAPAYAMLQGDFFELLRENGLPGTIADMIRLHIQQADAMGRFAG